MVWLLYFAWEAGTRQKVRQENIQKWPQANPRIEECHGPTEKDLMAFIPYDNPPYPGLRQLGLRKLKFYTK